MNNGVLKQVYLTQSLVAWQSIFSRSFKDGYQVSMVHEALTLDLFTRLPWGCVIAHRQDITHEIVYFLRKGGGILFPFIFFVDDDDELTYTQRDVYYIAKEAVYAQLPLLLKLIFYRSSQEAFAFRVSVHHRFESLTEREKEVCALWRWGWSTKQMARQLGVSANTVDVHRSHVIKKMGVKNTGELICLFHYYFGLPEYDMLCQFDR